MSLASSAVRFILLAYYCGLYPEIVMKGARLIFFFVCLTLVWLGAAPFEFFVSEASAQSEQDTFTVNQNFSDGKAGRRFGQWRQQVQERQIQSILVILQKSSGGKDTFVNLRFNGGQTFDNGRRVYLQDTNVQSVEFNLAGTAPQGQPLVLNVYNGEVHLSTVVVRYSPGGRSSGGQGIPSSGRPPFGGYKPDEQNRPFDNRYPNPNGNEGRGTSEGNNPYGAQPDAEMLYRCRSGRGIRPPRIELGDLRPTGGLFSGKYKAQGSMFGACVQEAGYFEEGRLKESLKFPMTDAYQRVEFSFTVKTGRRGELRIYSVSGDEDIISIDQAASQGSGGSSY